MNLSSPISSYIRDCTDLGKGYSEDLLKMFSNYKMWCKSQNKDYVGDVASFERNLQSFLPSISFGEKPTIHNGDSMAWSRDVYGIKVKPLNGNGAYSDDTKIAMREFEELYKATDN